MNELDNLYNVLEEQLHLYEDFLQIEKNKYDVIIKDDVNSLDEIVSKEQVFFLKSRGLDQKREAILKKLNMDNMTLKEVIDNVDSSNKDRFAQIHEKIYVVLNDFREKNNQCQNIAEIRMHRAQLMIKKLDESSNLNKQYFKDGSTGEVDINRTNIISKKI